MTTIRALPVRTLAGLATLSAAAFVAVTTETLPTGLLPQISAGFHVDQAKAGSLIAVYALVVAIGSIPLAIVTNRLPRKALILCTLAGYVVSSLMVVSTHSFRVAILARFIGGTSHALFFAVGSAYATRLVPPHLVGKSIAALQVGGSMALIAGTPLGTAIGLAAGWRSAFLVLAGAALVLMVAAARLLPPVPSSEPVSWSEAINGLRAPGLGIIAAISAVAFAAHYSAFTYISPLLRRGGIGQSHVALVLLLFGIGGMVGVWISGVAADRLPHRSMIASFAVLPVAMVLLCLSAGFPVGTVIGAVAWSTAFVATPTLITTAALRAGRSHPDMAAAMVNSACNIGISAGAIGGGFALNHAGLEGVTLLSAAVFVGGLALVLVAAHAFRLPSRTAALPAQRSASAQAALVRD
ncbi:MFS transporter [Acidothermaceae bacterium B102]|nr:MFS transporter [Acidothermaceae bacterium B102]